MTYYGPYCVTLREEMIVHGTSVFEENPFEFNRKHAIFSGQPVPPGYRATWRFRSDLAVSKLAPRIARGATATKFADILMEPRRDEPNCDYVEVHIYGPVHCLAIEHVSGPEPAPRADKALWKQIKRKLTEQGSNWSEC